MRQAVAARVNGVAALTMEALTKAFFTHLHSDHTIGYPDLIFTPAVTGRKEALRVWGPPGTQRMTEHILDAWSQDIETRLHGGEPSVPRAYEVVVSEFTAEGEIYRDDNISVSAFAVTHGTWKNAHGLRFATPDRVIVFSGDTSFCPDLIANAKGCDILVHEVYSENGLSKRTPEWQAYHSSFHTSGPDVGRVATEVAPKLLLLNHILAFGRPEEEVLAEVRSTFSGDVLIAEDLGVY